MKKILVSNISHRKSFDIISILSTKFPKVEIILGCEKLSLINNLKFKAIYSGNLVLLRTEIFDEFVIDLKSISEKNKETDIVYIPVEEQTTFFFISFIKTFGDLNFKYLLPDKNSFNLLRDKFTLNKYCLDNNIKAPKLFDIAKISFLLETDFPIILKPKIGGGSKGIIRIFSKSGITSEIIKIINQKEYVAQELIPNGRDVKGAFFLVNKGKVINSYTHERIRTSPSEGGVTVLSKISNNLEVLEAGANLLESVQWNGLVMLEYLYDKKENCYKIIEANPRLWGSILLSEYSGANLLTNYVNLSKGNTIEFSKIATDVRIRWFFPVDLLNYIKSFGQIKEFWNFKNSCFINYTYATVLSSFLFNLLAIFNINNFKRFLGK
jgi:predicted ATP-grasp superfamily ATP-dependent carboligase